MDQIDFNSSSDTRASTKVWEMLRARAQGARSTSTPLKRVPQLLKKLHKNEKAWAHNLSRYRLNDTLFVDRCIKSDTKRRMKKN